MDGVLINGGGLISDLSVKIYADGANFDEMLAMHANPLIKGFTTNPTLMRKAGVTGYAETENDASFSVHRC